MSLCRFTRVVLIMAFLAIALAAVLFLTGAFLGVDFSVGVGVLVWGATGLLGLGWTELWRDITKAQSWDLAGKRLAAVADAMEQGLVEIP
jgi:hypothetical protein